MNLDRIVVIGIALLLIPAALLLAQLVFGDDGEQQPELLRNRTNAR